MLSKNNYGPLCGTLCRNAAHDGHSKVAERFLAVGRSLLLVRCIRGAIRIENSRAGSRYPSAL